MMSWIHKLIGEFLFQESYFTFLLMGRGGKSKINNLDLMIINLGLIII